MSSFQDIVADAEKEAKKKLDEYRIKQEAELQAKQVQADLDKRIADRELELRREQYLKDKFSNDPDKYTKAMVANSISTRINVDKLITDFKPSTSTTSNRTTVIKEGEHKEDPFKMVVMFTIIIALVIFLAIVINEKNEKITALTIEKNNIESQAINSIHELEAAASKKAQEDIIIIGSGKKAMSQGIGKIAIVCGKIISRDATAIFLKGDQDTTDQRIIISFWTLPQEQKYIDWIEKISEVGKNICVTGKLHVSSSGEPVISVFNPLQVVNLR